MSVTIKTTYDNGYVVEILPDNMTDQCHSWLLLPAENLWSDVLRGILYVVAILYCFMGIAIASDIFMGSIEVITSKKRTVVRWDHAKQEKVEVKIMIWNETVANLTLMALGSSAPEILLATIESILYLGATKVEDQLGTFTIIGSAAFNLLIITGICIISVPRPDIKSIREFGVFIMTAIWSIWAYVWMLLVVSYISPGVVDPWEAWVTLGFMPLFVALAYCQDSGWWWKSKKVESDEDADHLRVLQNRPRAGSFTGHMLPGKELRVLEQERTTRLSSHHLVDREQDETSIELGSITEKASQVYRTTAEPQAFARARFRHAVVSAMTGGPRKLHHKRQQMADVVRQKMKLEQATQEGKRPEGDVLGKFTFASDRYAVLESAGHLDVDILFHRNIPSNSAVPNGSTSVAFKNGSVKISPESQSSATYTEVVTVEFETREGSAKSGKDFKYKKEDLVFRENEYRKTVSIDIINDNQFENDVDFYIILKNPHGGSGLGDPSVTRVTIIDDDGRQKGEPGEFEFSQDHCMADLSTGQVVAHVVREHGFDGNVTLQYSTIDGTAVGGLEIDSKVDYLSQYGKITFKHAETSKLITIDINKDAKGPKNFIITLKNPSLGAKIGTRSAVVCNITKDTIGDRLAEVIGDEEEEEVTWSAQFISAMSIGTTIDEDGDEQPPKCSDYILHFLTFFWKLIGACVPPATYCGAWPAFVLSLVYIGVLTAVVEQLGHLMGCVMNIKNSVTGITIIALGTSLPDTFASRTAAKQDEHADAAIGNVTGSNSVNVFLGLGIPWVLSTTYHLSKGTEYKVATDNLTQSVLVFSCLGAMCIALLMLRRWFVGGELGGKNQFVRLGSSLFLFFLWCIYILFSSLKAYDIISWEV